VQPKSIPFRRLTFVVALLIACAAGAHAAAVRSDHQPSASALETPFDAPALEVLGGLEGWQESPAHVQLFAPEAHRSQYRAFVSPEPLPTVLERIRARFRDESSGTWESEDLGPLDAYGPDGPYTPFELARLFTAGPVHVARGPHGSAHGFETWTLTSPYPDPSLARLAEGTLLLVLHVPPL
jgi:hypothetical protein